LPSISADIYAENVVTSLVSSKKEALDDVPFSKVAKPVPELELLEENNKFEDLISERSRSNCCLFCTKISDNLQMNLKHMSLEHSLYIPDIEHISSLETIVGYLRTVITEYNECLYCGMIKQSAEGIQRHMVDKGHCMINFEREPELLEFWEFSDSGGDETGDEDIPKPRVKQANTAVFKDLSQGEYILPSGKVVGTKNKAREARRLARRTALATKESSDRMITDGKSENTEENSSADPGDSLVQIQGGIEHQALAVRDSMGLVGVSDQQIRSLTTLQRKMQRQQAIVRASASWAGELGGTHQKHFKTKMNLRDG
jgi:pre-60S factor REI1